MVMVSLEHNGKKYSAKITHANRNGRNYYWVDVIDKLGKKNFGESFTFINNEGYNLSCLNQVTAENRKAISFLRRKIVQIFLHNNLHVNEGGFYQNT